ncbi:MAG: 16S rRNA (guanine(966)-N(2))-methyltransferase RsmD [Omnitrophica bacterium]|nr:16S rRNA (guanine(966)-N(2))-methyltransferase RsmD [Candidatus Omnitrophota bacterium]
MRIIGGTQRGRLIKMPKGRATRPTQDRVREAIFNIIRKEIPESAVLDLYAGSGAFGIEALSRGAHTAIFIDKSARSVKTIKSNLLSLGYAAPRAQVFKKDGVGAIEAFGKVSAKFDIAFIDPPYHKGLAKNALLKIDACDILAQHSFIIAEHFVKDPLPHEAGRLSLFKQKRYGDTVVSFYVRKG